MKVGDRLSSRKVVAMSDRPLLRSVMEDVRQSKLSTSSSSNDAKWTHDMYDGNISSNPGSVAFVRNLPASVTKQQLSKLFGGAGEIASIKIDPGPLTTARIGYVKKASAMEATKRFHGQKILNRPIKVSEYNSLDAKDQERKMSKMGKEDEDFYTEKPFALQFPTKRSVLISDVPHRSVFDRLG